MEHWPVLLWWLPDEEAVCDVSLAVNLYICWNAIKDSDMWIGAHECLQ